MNSFWHLLEETRCCGNRQTLIFTQYKMKLCSASLSGKLEKVTLGLSVEGCIFLNISLDLYVLGNNPYSELTCWYLTLNHNFDSNSRLEYSWESVTLQCLMKWVHATHTKKKPIDCQKTGEVKNKHFLNVYRMMPCMPNIWSCWAIKFVSGVAW